MGLQKPTLGWINSSSMENHLCRLTHLPAISVKENSYVLSHTVDQRQANYGQWTKSHPLPVFVIKVLLEHIHSFLPYLWLLSHYSSGVE